MQFISQSRRFGAAALGITGLGAVAVTLAAFHTVAKGAVAAVTSVSCSVTGSNWCISGNNSSSGIGVIGTSKSGTGLRGTSTSQYGLKATSGSGEAIFAQTTSGDAAITALGGRVNGNGVNASAGGVGISGTSTGTSSSSAKIGVLGYSTPGTGVYGLSTTGDGVDGSSTAGSGVYGISKNGVGVYGKSAGGSTGVYGLSNGGNGVYGLAESGGVGGYFSSVDSGDAVFAVGGKYGFYGVTGASGFPLTLGTGTNTVFQVDGNGNVTYSGTLQSVARAVGGGATRSFSPNSTEPTVEDTGTAQLVRGLGVVRLDPTFAASIEPTTGYRVFITPDGDTRGLFVASKTAAGFVVRESQAGRSTVAFDYRIVATKLGAAGQRMAMVSPAEARTLGSRVRLPAVPAVKLPAHLPVAAVDPATP